MVIIILALFIVSRINCSKYKDTQKADIGIVLFNLLESRINVEKTANKIRRKYVASNDEISILAKKHLVKNINLVVYAMLATGLLIMFSAVAGRFDNDNTNLITRDNAEGFEKNVDIKLMEDDETTEIQLICEPKIYTEKEFLTKADRIFQNIEKRLYKDEINHYICEDMQFDEYDESGLLGIVWSTDYPEYISSTGRVDWDNIPDKLKVIITATVVYESYEVSKDYNVTLIKKMKTSFEAAEEEINKIEESYRQEMQFVLPDKVGDIQVSVNSKDEKTDIKILVIGFLISVSIVCLRNRRLDEEVNEIKNELLSKYPDFVNHLWLYIGSGMTIKQSLHMYVKESEKCYLTNEIEYTLNLINAGCDEAICYEKLGVYLSVPEYSRLMSRISQNLVKGTKDIRHLMEEEINESLRAKKEYAKRKGEEASTKMLAPMMILLCVVLITIMTPAMMSF